MQEFAGISPDLRLEHSYVRTASHPSYVSRTRTLCKQFCKYCLVTNTSKNDESIAAFGKISSPVVLSLN